jgi:hypothetical protein
LTPSHPDDRDIDGVRSERRIDKGGRLDEACVGDLAVLEAQAARVAGNGRERRGEAWHADPVRQPTPQAVTDRAMSI